MKPAEPNPAIEAHQLLKRLWDWIREANPMVSRHEFIRNVETLAAEHLGFQLQDMPEVVGSVSDLHGSTTRVRFAGGMNRTLRLITVAQSLTLEVWRFTAAHEIGHVVLHPRIGYHRTIPVDRSRPGLRSRVEREADAFAAELLMPPGDFREEFLLRFGCPFDGETPDERNKIAFWLRQQASFRLDEFRFTVDPLYRAQLMAKASNYVGPRFDPLRRHFLVSEMAAALRLLELGLVR